MYGLPDYKIAVNHGEEKVYFGELALVNPFTDGDVDEYEWLDVPSMVEFVLNDLLPEHPHYEPVPCFSRHTALAVAFRGEADVLRALQQAASGGDENAGAALKTKKESLLLIADAGRGFTLHPDSIGSTLQDGIVMIRSRG